MRQNRKHFPKLSVASPVVWIPYLSKCVCVCTESLCPFTPQTESAESEYKMTSALSLPCKRTHAGITLPLHESIVCVHVVTSLNECINKNESYIISLCVV